MNEQELFNNELNKIRENMIIELSHSWGLRYAGYQGIIVNTNKEVYSYQFNIILPDNSEGEKKYLKKIKALTENEFDMLSEFIKKEITSKEFENKIIRDASYKVTVNYNGIKKSIINNKGYAGNLEIYDKTEKFLNELIYS